MSGDVADCHVAEQVYGPKELLRLVEEEVDWVHEDVALLLQRLGEYVANGLPGQALPLPILKDGNSSS